MILSIITTLVVIAQEGGSGPSSDDLTLGGLVATTSAIGVLLMWIRQVVKDRDAERAERQATQAKYDILAQQALPVLANAIPALDKVTTSLESAHRTEIDEFKHALKGLTADLRKGGQ